jgi:integrase/recombinase XerD
MRGNQDISPRPLSGKTIRNCWAACSSFWNWATDEFDISSPFRVPAPRATTRVIEPLTENDIKKLLSATTNRRDEALLLVLLDSGARVSELCYANVGDLDLKSGRLWLTKTKNARPRPTFLGRTVRKAVWTYLALRDPEPDAPLFERRGRRMNRNSVRLALARLGKRANVERVHPHRLRHTFAICYLRNSGDVFTLQQLLGHRDLSMVRRYLHLAQSDLAEAHRRASPIDVIRGPASAGPLLWLRIR